MSYSPSAHSGNFKFYSDTVVDLGSKNTNFTVDITSGVVQKATITGACTISFSGWVLDRSTNLVLLLTNPGTNVTWQSGIKWDNGVAPTLSTSGTDRIVLVSDDGTSIQGFVAGLDIK